MSSRQRFGLIEMAEYRYADPGGVERTIVQPRVLARTTVIERHVLRVEVPGLVIDAIEPAPAVGQRSSNPAPTDAALAWRAFVERFVAEARFDDPGQPAPRRGGNGWMRVPMPGSLYINLYRSSSQKRIGAQISFAGQEARIAWEALLADRDDIDREFVAAGLSAPEWYDGEAPQVILTSPSPLPWDEHVEAQQRAWMGPVANQLVNSFRPRLQRLAGPAGEGG